MSTAEPTSSVDLAVSAGPAQSADSIMSAEPSAGSGVESGSPAGADSGAGPGTTPTAPTVPGLPNGRAELASLEDIEEALKDVVDPELGINVVDLGLVYGVHVSEDHVATVDMTLTSAACPLTDVIEDQARSALCSGPGGGLVDDMRINWVWIPPWGPDKITDEGRDQLRALGFNV